MNTTSTREFIKYPKIGQFRQVIKHYKEFSAYCGKDNEGLPIMDYSKPLPTVAFTGTIKLHGTNASVVYNPVTEDLYAQSRNNIITVDKDNAGFAFFVESNKAYFKSLCKRYEGEATGELITVFGEWCGGNIQKRVALTGLPKMFVIFGVKVGEEWVDIKNLVAHDSVYTVHQFPTYTMDIDFNKPELSVPKLQEITLAIEELCPVGLAFGVEGVGEGIVWTDKHHNMFKVKGDKHSSSKVKKLASVDVDKINSINEFVEYAVTENRLNQGIEQVFTTESREVEMSGLGDFLKWLMRDIVSEEMETMNANNLEPKEIGKGVTTKARAWFKDTFFL